MTVVEFGGWSCSILARAEMIAGAILRKRLRRHERLAVEAMPTQSFECRFERERSAHLLLVPGNCIQC